MFGSFKRISGWLKRKNTMEDLRTSDVIWICVGGFLLFASAIILNPTLGKIGENLRDWIFESATGDMQSLGTWLVDFVFFQTYLTFRIPINLLVIGLAIAFLIIAYRALKFIIQSRKVILPKLVFTDNFSGSPYCWIFPYWGAKNPKSPGMQVVRNSLVVSADLHMWHEHQNYENGAYIELRDNIEAHATYEIKCLAQSETGCSMGFKLWIHDSVGGEGRSVMAENFETPPPHWKEYRILFTTTDTKRIRIHLHCKAGNGLFVIRDVAVSLVKERVAQDMGIRNKSR